MISKAEQLRAVRDKKQARINKLQQEVDVLDKRALEAENEEIITTIRTLCMGPEEIASLLQGLRGKNEAPISYAGDKATTILEEDSHVIEIEDEEN